MAVSNTPLIKYLVTAGARVTVFDQKTAAELAPFLNQLAGLKLEYQFGPDYLSHLSGFEYVFTTPGMKKSLPELQQARAAGAVFSSEMELFFELCPGRIIGITGSSGKTTTTTLVGLMLKAYHPQTFVGGNIGCSLLERLPEMDRDTLTVLELSSFQLQELKQSPYLAVITNVTPNHLDMHASMQEYIDAKSNIIRYQKPDQIAVLNYDNQVTRDLADLVQGKAYYFSRHDQLKPGAFLQGNDLRLALNNQVTTFTNRERLKLLGDHNVENILTAALVAGLLGVPFEIIARVAEEFSGVEHRLELVRELNGVKYYNDSISTTPDRAIAGLRAMTQPTVLIAGGYDKQLPFEGLAPVIINNCKHLLLLGVTAPKIETAVKAIKPDFPITRVANLEAAVAKAATIVDPGEVVLLSPACASYDMFNNYQERGRLFKQLVREL